MEVLSESCASFREIKAISSKLTIYLLYFVNFFTLGNFGQNWGRDLEHLADEIQADADGCKVVQ